MATTQQIPFQIPSKEVNRISKIFSNTKKTCALILAVECPHLMVKERAALVQVHRTTLWRWSKDPVYMREYVRLTELKNKHFRTKRRGMKFNTLYVEHDKRIFNALVAA